ncbi:MAG: lipopolysaccharide kinase InaA family protein [Gammaproteobacteria bacterium]
MRDLVLHGPAIERFTAAIVELLAGRLPTGWRWIASSRFARVACGSGGDAIYYKEFLPRSVFEGVKSWLRGSRCQRAVQQAALLEKHGFATPPVLGWGRCGAREFMLTQAIASEGFADYGYRCWTQRPLPAQALRAKRALLRALGAEVGRLHRIGIAHGDLRPNNLLLHFLGNQARFYWIDNERNRQYRRVPMRKIRKNLVQINMLFSTALTRTDRLRFLCAYQQAYGRFGPQALRELARRVQRRTEERLAGKPHPPIPDDDQH